VHGATASYVGNADHGVFQLSWIEHGQGFVVATTPGCVGDTPASEDVMLAVASGLTVPS
jgi:hypothetical protein